MKFHKQHWYMFQVTHKVNQIKRLTTSSVKNNRTHTSEAVNQFSDCRWTNSCPILNERVCEVIPHLWLSWPRTCMMLEYVPYMLCWINIRGLSGQSIHPIPFALSVLIDKTNQARKSVSVHSHKVLVHITSIRVSNASLISSQKWYPVKSSLRMAYKSVEQS